MPTALVLLSAATLGASGVTVLPRAGASSAQLAGQASPGGELPFVGAIFPAEGAAHSCSGSVVHLAGQPAQQAVVLTAAHCVTGTGQGMQFAPGYHDGVMPFGAWTVSAVYADRRWTTAQDTQYDYAAVVLAARSEHGRTMNLGDVVTGPEVGPAPESGQPVLVVAYVQGSGDRPITCARPSYRVQGYPAFDCHGFLVGTSGGPWLTGGPGRFVVRGLVGGLHQGGCDEFTSYSPPFDTETLAVLSRAVSGAPGDVFPEKPDDGC